MTPKPDSSLYRLGRERGYRACERAFWQDVEREFGWEDVDYLLWAYEDDPFIQSIAYRLAGLLPPP